jgi:hypothetical protein
MSRVRSHGLLCENGAYFELSAIPYCVRKRVWIDGAIYALFRVMPPRSLSHHKSIGAL